MTRNFGGAIPASAEAITELIELFNPTALFEEFGWRSQFLADQNNITAESYLNAIYIHIDELASRETIAVARVFMGDGVSYEITVSSETGGSIMVCLQDERIPGPMHYYMSVLPENPRTTIIPFSDPRPPFSSNNLTGTFYLHISNHDVDIMTGITVRIVPSGELDNIELLDFTT